MTTPEQAEARLRELAENYAKMVYPVLHHEAQYRVNMRNDMAKYFLRFLHESLEVMGVETTINKATVLMTVPLEHEDQHVWMKQEVIKSLETSLVAFRALEKLTKEG